MRYWNNQKYCECQLITLWNAAIYYKIRVPIRYGKEYVMDCEKAYAINGGCINSNHVINKLNLKAIKGKLDWNWIKVNCPIEFSIFCHRGYHSVLAIDINLKNKKVLLANYAREKLYWIKIDKLIKMHNKNVNPIKWNLRIKKGEDK